HVEQAWFNIENFLAHESAPAELEAVAQKVADTYFGDFETMRQSVYAAGATGQPYPIAASEWMKGATAGIETILAMADATVGIANAATGNASSQAQQAIIGAGTVLLFGVLLSAGAIWVAVSRIVNPIQSITTSMTALADGRLETEVPHADRAD